MEAERKLIDNYHGAAPARGAWCINKIDLLDANTEDDAPKDGGHVAGIYDFDGGGTVSAC